MVFWLVVLFSVAMVFVAMLVVVSLVAQVQEEVKVASLKVNIILFTLYRMSLYSKDTIDVMLKNLKKFYLLQEEEQLWS